MEGASSPLVLALLGVITLALVPAMRGPKQRPELTRGLGFLVIAGLAAVSWSTGGFDIAVLIWCTPIPIASVVLTRDDRSAYVWAAGITALCLALFSLETFMMGWEAMAPERGDVLSLIALTWLQSAQIAEYERTRQATATQIHHLERALHTRHRLDVVGGFAGAVAHRFNNLLAVVQAQAEMAQRQDPSPGVARHLSAIKNAAGQGAALTAGLQQLTAPRTEEPETLDLGQLVDELAELLPALVGDETEHRCDLDGSDLPVRCVRAGLENATLRLIDNARRAMPGGGTLTLSAHRAVATELEDIDLASGNNDFAVLTVADTGMGMDERTRQHAADPFFSNWASFDNGVPGAGMGLASVEAFAQRWGGGVRIRSEPRKGTQVEVVIPLYDPAVTDSTDSTEVSL